MTDADLGPGQDWAGLGLQKWETWPIKMHQASFESLHQTIIKIVFFFLRAAEATVGVPHTAPLRAPPPRSSFKQV